MFLESRMLFIYTEAPLHAGTGTGLGAVDLPIQRERITGYPIIQASGIKGALRSEAPDGKEKTAVFGHEKAEHAGSLSPGDARLLLFPVRSLAGVFAWTTSCDALARFRRDAVAASLDKGTNPVPELPATDPSGNSALASGTRILVGPKGQQKDSRVGRVCFSGRSGHPDNILGQMAGRRGAAAPNSMRRNTGPWRDRLKDSLLVLPEEAFRDFLLHATEVVTRIKLQPDSKIVVGGALWTQEHLPGDSLLYAPVHATKLRVSGNKPSALADDTPDQEARKVLNWARDKVPQRIQLGGDETVGRGIVRLRWNGGA